MHHRPNGKWTLSTLLLSLALVFPGATLASNSTIPWMTGDFYGGSSFGLMPTVSPDGQWYFWIETSPILNDQWSFECGNGVCTAYGGGPITGGPAIGALYQWDGSMWNEYADFSGWVTGGNDQKTELWYGDTLVGYDYQFWFGFRGAWTNGWNTVGSVYGWQFSAPPGDSVFSITTSTPEPASIAMLTTGLLATLGALRRKPKG